MTKYIELYKTMVVRKTTDLTRTHTYEKMTEAPNDVVFHFSNNFDKPDPKPVPPINFGPLQLNPEQKTVVFPTTEPLPTDRIVVDAEGIHTLTRGVNESIKAWKSDHARVVRLVHGLEDLKPSSSRQALVCYNPQYLVRSKGKYIPMRVFDIVHRRMLNSTLALPDYYHLLHFELQNTVYSITDFTTAYKSPEPNRMAYPNSMQYNLILQLLLFVSEYREHSVYNELSKEEFDRVTLMLTKGEKIAFFNLGILREMSEKDKNLDRKIIHLINLITEEKSEDIVDEEAAVPRELRPEMSSPKERVRAMQGSMEDVIAGETTDDEVIRAVVKEAIRHNPDPLLTELLEQDTIKVNEDAAKALRKASENAQEQILDIPIFNGTPVAGPKSLVREDLSIVEERELALDKRLDNSTELSTAQKKRVKKVSEKWKDLSVAGPDGEETNLQELLNTPPGELENSHIDTLDGEVRDESLLDTKLQTMDSQYVEKNMTRDVVRTALSLPGMHPVDIKTKRIDDPVNRMMEYTIKFEDEHGVSHTNKFTFPIPDEHGLCMINGSEKTSVKQRINLPICKVSPDRVSLSSNFNKTLVERHDAVAYSWLTSVNRGIEKGEWKSKKVGRYPYKTKTTITLTEEERKAAEKGSFFTIVRTNKEADQWIGKLDTHHLQSSAGEIQVIRHFDTKSEFYPTRSVTSEQEKALKSATKAVVLEAVKTTPPTGLAYEYTQTARNYTFIEKKGIKMIFDWFGRFEDLDQRTIEKIRAIEKDSGNIYLGIKERTTRMFMETGGLIYFVNISDGSQLQAPKTLLEILYEDVEQKPKPQTEWLDVQILNKTLPIGYMLCYRYGLMGMLSYLKVKYERLGKNGRLDPPVGPSDIVLRFADEKIIIRQAGFVNRVIFSGLNFYELKNHPLETMETPDPYFIMLDNSGMSTNYLKGVDNFFDLFVDPQTRDVLLQMGEPTNFRDLLIRSAQLLATTDNISPSSTACSRIRSFDRMPATLYNEMSRAYADWKHQSNSGSKMSINPYDVQSRIVGDQLMNNADTINPIDDLKRYTKISHLGEGGRSEQTFMIPDRNFTDDSMGVVSEATVDSGSVAVNASLSFNANLTTMTGMGSGKSSEEVKPSELLSGPGLFIPGTTHDDGKRANFGSIQASHVVPTKEGDPYPVTTGFDKVLAHRTRMPFAYEAKGDGKVLNVDEDASTVSFEYKDGSVEVIDIGEQVSKNPGAGMDLSQEVVLNNLKEGTTFKKGEILAYNTSFFVPTMDDKREVQATFGVTENVAFMEVDQTIEDSSIICKELAERLEFGAVHTRDVVINKDTNVRSISLPGTEVVSTDPIMIFDEADVPEGMNTDDADLNEMLGELNRATPRAQNDGRIAKIEVFHTCPYSEMSKSVANSVKKANDTNNKKAKAAKGTDSETEFPEYKALENTDRVGITDLGKDRILFRFYVLHDSDMTGGSKVIYSTSLKSVVAQVLPETMTTEDNHPVRAVSSYRGVNNRLVTGVLFTGSCARVLDKLTDKVKEIADM